MLIVIEEILSWFCHGMESLESRIKVKTKYTKYKYLKKLNEIQ